MRILLVLLTLTLVSACDTLDPCGSSGTGFAEKADRFFAEARASDLDASDARWEPFDERLVELVEVCYPEHEDALTRAEDRAFWRGVSGYYVHRYGRAGAKGFLRKLDRGVRDRLREVEDALDEVD